MDDLIQAIKSNDLVAVRKVFESAMAPVVADLIEERKVEIARSIMIEGEEPDEENESEDDGEDKVKRDEAKAKKKNKEESDGKDADEGDDDDKDEDD